MKGLIIQKPWIDLILSGEKSWEMRPRSWSHRGPLALIEKGSGKVVGVATVTDCLPPLTRPEMRQHFSKHQIPDAIYGQPDFKWFTPLVLTNVLRLNPPVPYQHKNGAQNPVNLDPDAERDVLRQLGRPHTLAALSSSSIESGSRKRVATTSQLDQVYASSRREGGRLIVDIEIQDSWTPPQRSFARSPWIELLGMWAVVSFLFCQLAFIVHFALGMVSSSISALVAFKWLIPMFVSVVIACLCGQGELFQAYASQPASPSRRRRRR